MSDELPTHAPLDAPPQIARPPDLSDPISLQILATEHWSLLATRSLSWTELFARTGMFFTVLSGAMVALALIAQATAFGETFVVFALVLLPVVLFVGVASYLRVVDINNEDARWVMGMNRLRAAYIARRPELAPHFITGLHDDIAGLSKTYANDDPTQSVMRLILFGFTTTPAMLGTVTSVVAGAIGATVALQLDASVGVTVASGGGAFAVTFVLLMLYQFRVYARLFTTHVPHFPAPQAKQ